MGKSLSDSILEVLLYKKSIIELKKIYIQYDQNFLKRDLGEHNVINKHLQIEISGCLV